MVKKGYGLDEDGQQVRIQLQVSEVASPELYADLSAVKVRSRRYRLVHLAALGLLMERSMLQGGGNTAALANPTALALAPVLPFVQAPASSQRNPTKNKGGAATKDVAGTLDVPDGFGDALVNGLNL